MSFRGGAASALRRGQRTASRVAAVADALLRRQAAGGRGACGCLQPCSSLAFASERSQAEYHWGELLAAMGESPLHHQGFHMTRVHIFLRDEFFIANRRSELYGYTDFLANCGGLLGLGLGVSVLSLVELLCCCCPRPRRP